MNINKRTLIKGFIAVAAVSAMPALATSPVSDYADHMPVREGTPFFLSTMNQGFDDSESSNHPMNLCIERCRNMGHLTRDEFNQSITPETVAFYANVPADDKLVFHVNRGRTAIARETRRGAGNNIAFMDDHILIWYRDNHSSLDLETGPCAIVDGKCVVNRNYQKYFAIIKTDMTSSFVKNLIF